jgi:flagellin
MLSVNTNGGALAALQSLSQTNRDLQVTQGRINTGLKVANAVDNGAVFAIAEAQRTRVDALGAVKGGIDRAKSAIDFGVKAGEAVNEILKQMRTKAQEAAGPSLSTEDRAKLNTDFQKLSEQIDGIVSGAAYNGTNLASGGAAVSVLTTDQGATPPTTRVIASRLAATFGADATANARYVSGTQTLVGTDTEYENGDGLDITVGSNVYSVTFNTGDTINSLVDKINDAAGGAVTASFDSARGELVYKSASNFSIAYTNAGAAAPTGADLAFLIGTGAGQDLSTATAGAQATTAARYGGGNAGASTTVTGGDFTRTTLGVGSLTVTDTSNASASLTAIDSALNTLRTSLSSLGSQSKALGVQSTFLGQLSDTLKSSVGNLVDADLAEESARLQSLQVKQQLGAQALSIANQSPQIILSFFR